jgi:ribonuclease BN (tRNA processing enzyme)
MFSPWVLGRAAPLDLFGPPGAKGMVDHIEAAWQQDIDIRVHGLEHGNETGYKVTVHEIQPGVLHEVYSETEPEHGHHNGADWPEYMRQFHTSTAQVAEIANQAKPKLLVVYHQVWGSVEDEALLKEVRRTYQGNVRSAKDLDVY